MKKTLIILVTALSAVSCSYFLEKPDTTGTVDQAAVFSSSKNAFGALMSCYRDVLRHGWPGGIGIGHSTLGPLCGERQQAALQRRAGQMLDNLIPTPRGGVCPSR